MLHSCTAFIFFSLIARRVIPPWAVQGGTKFHYLSANRCHFLDCGDDTYLDCWQKNNSERRESLMQRAGGSDSQKLLAVFPNCFLPFSWCACRAGSGWSLVSQLQDLAVSWTELTPPAADEGGHIRDVKRLHLAPVRTTRVQVQCSIEPPPPLLHPDRHTHTRQTSPWASSILLCCTNSRVICSWSWFGRPWVVF